MKKLFLLLFFIASCYQISDAQNTATLDNEKVLEYYQSQRYAEAAQYLQSIYKDGVDDPKALTQLAYANLMGGKYADAEKYYLKLYTQNPTSLPVLFSLADINTRRGNESKAKSYYQEVIKIDSANFSAYKKLAYLTKEDINNKKISYLLTANRLNPIDADIVFDLCEIYFKTGAFHKLKQTLEPALKADSTNLRLLKIKIPLHVAEKNYPEAIKTGEQILGYGDSSTFVLNNLGKSHFLSLDYQNALKYFLLISDKSADNETLLYNIGMSYRGIKDYKNAIPYLQNAIKEGVSPKIATYYGLLGDSFEMTNKNDDANNAYKKGLQFENNGSLLYNIALVYETKLNDKKNALTYYEQYLKTIDEKQQPKLIIFIKRKIEELKK
ncbi:tetratricopeptide repeat protein [Pedobacter frigoris]|uniref:Tetratricopeptide repeat protein n=1 Tax=Pedobacter frigoris TaxID=2571272 RepID=A0A4U1CLM8_9SPHI|nr:tetratricopeptide repeat protein [Pedobacter frigoris]TKC08717.1 tetratricopeptide repeat protein [Pedobacter frigoris]